MPYVCTDVVLLIDANINTHVHLLRHALLNLSYVSGGSIGEPRIQPDYVELLNNLLKDIVVNHPKLHYYLPPYTDEEKWKRCIADYFWVFIDRSAPSGEMETMPAGFVFMDR